MLQTSVPEQSLSITTNPNVLKQVEKKYIVDILKKGESVIPKRVNDEGKELQSDESYVMMRKFGLILLRDIMEERDSIVHREFSKMLTPEDEVSIREKFKQSPTIPDDDINTSVDQTKRLIVAIKKNNLEYPAMPDGLFHHADILAFLDKLSYIFDWPKYEAATLGKPSLRSWYAVILSQWMSGTGLNSIMKKVLDYRRQHPDDFWINKYMKTVYNDSDEHKNIVFADTLEVIENIVLFSIANYFLRFSNEYKQIHGVIEFDNNWYEYVEYGTTNPLTILLQRNGFSREAATYIRNNQDEYVVRDGSTGKLKLKATLLECGNTNVENECKDIRYNVPGLFA